MTSVVRQLHVQSCLVAPGRRARLQILARDRGDPVGDERSREGLVSAFNGRGNTRTAGDESTNHRFIYDQREIVTVFRSTRIVSPILDTLA